LPNESTAGLRRLQLIIAYDGTGFAGWQSQANGSTVQDEVEKAIRKVTGHPARVHGAGRTDAGVHALEQSTHVDLETGLAPERLRAALNASLPPTIRIVRCRFRSTTFHARFSAIGKIYRYRIATGPVLSPFEINRAWHVPTPLDLGQLKAAADEFLGRHDFAAFAASRGKPVASTVRTIRRVRVHRRRGIITLEFEGDGFLYRMVRMMVGAIVQVASGRLRREEIRERLRTGRAPTHRATAPAAGLTLVRVKYAKVVGASGKTQTPQFSGRGIARVEKTTCPRLPRTSPAPRNVDRDHYAA
jgi:tRNA pseudouridine38-40 synthase